MRLQFHRPTFIFSVGFVGLIVVVSLAASWIAPFDFAAQDLDRVLLTPNSINWLGTDQLGRDLFSRLIFGARVSLTVALASAVVGMFLGIGLGALAGYVGGWADRLIMRSIDIFQSLPQFVIMVLISSYFHDWGARHDFEVGAVLGMFVALCLVSWASIARLVRGQVSHLKTMPFVESAVVIGGTDLTVLMKHILPNISGSVLVMISFQVASNVLYESFLSFVGLGLQPPFSSWGVLLFEGWQSLRSYPHLILSPGVVVFLTMLSFNFIAEGLRDYLDPKSSR